MIAIYGLFLATLGLIWYLNYSGKKKLKNGLKELPGPKGLPLLGNMLNLGDYPYLQFSKWVEQYGSMYKVKTGTFNNMIVADPQLCKEIFNDPMITGRIQAPVFDLWEDTPGLGLFGSEGELWSTHRRFLLRQLRDFGFGKSSLESTIMEEVKELIQLYKMKVGKPVTQIRETMRLAVVNALWSIMGSERFEITDPRLLKLANNTSESFNEVIQKGGILLFLPWVRHFIPELCGYNSVRKVLEENKEFFMRSIETHKKNFQEEEQNDFIDVYLAEMKKHEGDPKSQFSGEIAERQLAAICFDMFFAGSDTTAITTAWTSLFLCKFPYAQKKFHQEISEVTGDTRHVSLSDRSNMPYTNALIDEIFRFSTIVPDGVPHRALVDREFHGYHIPKDTLVQPSHWYIHHDKKLWGDPENFRPERFLSADGKKYVKSENLQPFQVGRRQCLGESLARDNIFLFLTNLFQQFSMVFDPSDKEPTLDSEVGFLRAPLPYTVIMTDKLAK